MNKSGAQADFGDGTSQIGEMRVKKGGHYEGAGAGFRAFARAERQRSTGLKSIAIRFGS